MKILLTSDWYIPAVNGVVTSLLNLRKGLEERGHEVRILTLSHTPHSFSKDGVTYIGSVPAGIIYPGARLKSAFGGKLIRELINWEPDVVHSNCEFSTFRLAYRIAKRLDIPLIHTYHTVYENYTHYFSPSKKWGRKMVKAFSGYVAAATDCMIAPTEKVKKLLEGYDISKPVYVLPTGIEQGWFMRGDMDVDRGIGMDISRDSDRNIIRKQYNIPDNHTLLVYVGRLAKEKNCGELLRGVAGFRNKAVSLLMVGDGPCRAELEEQSHILGLDKQVIFAGMVPRDDVWRYYAAGDLFVSASTSETQGLTFLEALSSALPMLCHKDDCLNGILINDVNGWQYETEAEFAKRLEWFMHHPGLWDGLRRRAAESGKHFSISAFAGNAELIYNEQIMLHRLMQEEVMA